MRKVATMKAAKIVWETKRNDPITIKIIKNQKIVTSKVDGLIIKVRIRKLNDQKLAAFHKSYLRDLQQAEEDRKSRGNYRHKITRRNRGSGP